MPAASLPVRQGKAGGKNKASLPIRLVTSAIDGKEAKMVGYRLPSVGTTLQLDRHCPDCHRRHGRIHSGVHRRRIRDWKVCWVPQRRMLCPHCGLTWTLRAGGIHPGRQRSDRARALAVLAYMLGLSYRGVAMLLRALDSGGSKSTAERDVAEAGQKAQGLHQASRRLGVRVLGVDGTGAAMAGRDAGMLFFVDIDGRRLLFAARVQERDAAAVRRHVRSLMRQVGAQELRTDELGVYEGIVPEGQHRLCLAHWRKSKGKRAYELGRQAVADNRPLEAESMRRLLELLRLKPRPPTPPPELESLVRRYSRCRKGLLWKINQLLQHVERTWEKVSDDPADPTNNITERIIGLTFKIRAKTMRGFKATHKLVAHPYLASFLRGQAGACDLQEVI